MCLHLTSSWPCNVFISLAGRLEHLRLNRHPPHPPPNQTHHNGKPTRFKLTIACSSSHSTGGKGQLKKKDNPTLIQQEFMKSNAHLAMGKIQD